MNGAPSSASDRDTGNLPREAVLGLFVRLDGTWRFRTLGVQTIKLIKAVESHSVTITR